MIAIRRRSATAHHPPPRRGSRPGRPSATQHMHASTRTSGWTGPAHPHHTFPLPKGKAPGQEELAVPRERSREREETAPVARRTGTGRPPVAGRVRSGSAVRGCDWDVSAGHGAGARKGARERDKTRRRPLDLELEVSGWMRGCDGGRGRGRGLGGERDCLHAVQTGVTCRQQQRPCDPALLCFASRRFAAPGVGLPVVGCLPLLVCQCHRRPRISDVNRPCDPAWGCGHDCRGFVVRLLLRYILQ